MKTKLKSNRGLYLVSSFDMLMSDTVPAIYFLYWSLRCALIIAMSIKTSILGTHNARI